MERVQSVSHFLILYSRFFFYLALSSLLLSFSYHLILACSLSLFLFHTLSLLSPPSVPLSVIVSFYTFYVSLFLSVSLSLSLSLSVSLCLSPLIVLTKVCLYVRVQQELSDVNTG